MEKIQLELDFSYAIYLSLGKLNFAFKFVCC